MKVIFLDYDGVLNSAASMEEERVDAQGHNVDPACVSRLRRLLIATSAKVVVSSSWRIVEGLATLRDAAQLRRTELVGVTPPLDAGNRGVEVQAWLDVFGPVVDSYVILDDAEDFSRAQMPRLVRTSFAVGLTDADVDRAIALLGFRIERCSLCLHRHAASVCGYVGRDQDTGDTFTCDCRVYLPTEDTP